MEARGRVLGEPDISIVGLGPAGSLLAWKAAEAGYRVVAYDLQKTYTKPCGDAVIIREEYEDLLKASSSITGRVKRHVIEVSGYGGKIIEHEAPAWYIVDKTKLVEYFKEEARVNGAKIVKKAVEPHDRLANIVVDARGPYAHIDDNKTYIMTYRVFVETDSWDNDTALLYFETKRAGLAWIFPSYLGENIVNAGGGIKGGSLPEVKKYVHGFLKQHLGGDFKVIGEKAAPIAVYSNVNPVVDGVIRIGEAAGLINSAGGEGIRMALLSSLIAYESLSDPNPLKRYRELVAPLVKESLLTRRLLRSIESIEPERGARLLYDLPDVFWKGFLRGNTSRMLLLRSFIVKPGVGIEALRVLLSSRS